MKRNLVALVMAIGFGGALASTPLAAQSTSQEADIPFTFVVSNHNMPAGKYRVSRLTQGAPVYALYSDSGPSISVHFSQNEEGKPQNPSLTFACYGKECVLAKITPPDSETAYSLSDSAIEKNLPHKLGMASVVAIKLGVR